jgi:hypothetical protein
MDSSKTRNWLERIAWIGALTLLAYWGYHSLTTARATAPNATEVSQHSSWVIRFNGL